MPTITLDAAGKPLGRLASEIAHQLQGKHLPTYRPEKAPGVTVEVRNAAQMALTGQKKTDAVRSWHSGYPGGLKTVGLGEALSRNPERVLRHTVSQMLPRNRRRALLLKRLIIYP